MDELCKPVVHYALQFDREQIAELTLAELTYIYTTNHKMDGPTKTRTADLKTLRKGHVHSVKESEKDGDEQKGEAERYRQVKNVVSTPFSVKLAETGASPRDNRV